MTLQEQKDLFPYVQNHLVLGLSLWCSTKPVLLIPPHLIRCQHHFILSFCNKNISQQWPWNAIQFSKSIWLLKQSSFCVLKKSARKAFFSEKRARGAEGTQKNTFPKNVVVGRLEELDVVLHAAVGALRLLQPIPQVLEAAFISALCLHRGAQKRLKGSNIHPVHVKLLPRSAEESQN